MEQINVDKHLYRLKGVVQHYDWGGSEFITQVTGSASNGQPMAEYWLGAHSSAPSAIDEPNAISLEKLIQSQPAKYLGNEVAQQFGRLPFLLKLLDVKEMLSIQVHPSKDAAELDFKRENDAGIPLTSSKRNYKDSNHKPELMVAMSEFWLLHGFKEKGVLVKTLSRIPELNFLIQLNETRGYEEMYREIMSMPQRQVNEILTPLVARIGNDYSANRLEKSSEDYWAAKAAVTFSGDDLVDRGIFSIYLFNLVKLNKGEAIFQDAGVPHAYLEGRNVEIMASSDNVLRGGLTTKHIDVNELLRHVKCVPTQPEIIRGEVKGRERVFGTSAPDFELSMYELPADEEVSIQPRSVEIFLLLEGRSSVREGGNSIILELGKPAAIAFPGEKIQIRAMENAVLFRAKSPIHNR